MMEREEAQALIKDLTSFPAETEWFEFKTSFFEAEAVGKTISALSNSAVLHQKDAAYLIYGINDKTHEIVGTKFDHLTVKVGDEDIVAWLTDHLNPTIDFRISVFTIDGKKVAIFEIPPTLQFVTKFRQVAYIRNGSYTKPLSKYPAKEKALWKLLETEKFEKHIAKSGLTPDEVLNLIDYNAYFRILEIQRPSDNDKILKILITEGLISKKRGMYCVTNLGALLFANNISNFESLSKKTPRLVVYSGNNKSETKLDIPGARGYALAVDALVSFIMGQIPVLEVSSGAQKRLVPIYPEKTIRELVINSLIHQDFNIVGSGPMIEIYDDRMEITNPGVPLIDVDRFIDAEPRSRNEKIADLMRRLHFCEERGSGVDNAVRECEDVKLPGPKFMIGDSYTRVIIYGPRELKDMDTLEKMNTVYLHAVIRYMSNDSLTNESLRLRLNVKKENHSQVSRLIKLALTLNLLKKKDPYSKSTKFVSYIPFWA